MAEEADRAGFKFLTAVDIARIIECPSQFAKRPVRINLYSDTQTRPTPAMKDAMMRAEMGDAFHIEVAAYPEVHPQAKSPEADLHAFALKVKAGANSAITQYFFNSDAYFRFVDDAYALGVDVPVVPGIMPILGSSQLLRFSDACGAEIPRWIRLRLQAFGDDTASIKAFGLDVVTDLCDQLLSAGAPALHFYTMNQSAGVGEIIRRLQER